MNTNNISLVVSSCDKYSTAWYPYFELIKRFWPKHPKKIFLITEKKNYSHPELDIIVVNGSDCKTWSERLLKTLAIVDTEYLIFSLEDFFLLGNVDNKSIRKCLKWMENDKRIAQCRLSTWESRGEGNFYDNDLYFKDTPANVPFRVDTQVGLWRKSALIDIIDKTESPWAFESYGTQRAKKLPYIFLRYYINDMYDVKNMVFPYLIDQHKGYGIAWGHWLWNNKKWFNECCINGVNFWRLGTISQKCARHRFEYVYTTDAKKKYGIKGRYYNLCRQAKYALHNTLSMGLLSGLRKSISTLVKHLR